MINGITFSEQLITSADFAHFMYTFLNKANGITKGCAISNSDGKIYIQKGYFMEFGRMVQVIGTEEIETPDVLSGQLYCTLVFEIDLTQINTADEFNQGYFKTLTQIGSYPTVTQEDLDDGGTLYQMPWCQYMKTPTGITSFRDLRQILDLSSVWAAVSSQNTQYKGEFDSYFAAQQTVIESMIADLQAEGYVPLETAREVKLVSLPASGWSSTAPYVQTVKVNGILAIDTPVIKEYVPAGSSAADEKAIKKAAGMISYVDTIDGSITVTCIGKKPATDIQIMIKAV